MKFLVVEDFPVTRLGVMQMIRSHWTDARIDEACTIAEALSILKTSAPDVIVMDLNFPDAVGVESLSSIRRAAAAAPLLVFSAHAEHAYARRCLQEGAQGYLCKDRGAEELVTAVEAVISGRRYITASLASELAEQMLGNGDTGRPAHEALSSREARVMLLLAHGKSVGEISEILHLSPKTISTYRTRLLEKLALQGNVDLAKYCLEHGLIRPE